MTQLLQSIADGKIVLVLEGGYNVQTVTDSVVSCIEVLLGKQAPPPKMNQNILSSVLKTVDQVKSSLSLYWNCMRPFYVPINGMDFNTLILLLKEIL